MDIAVAVRLPRLVHSTFTCPLVAPAVLKKGRHQLASFQLCSIELVTRVNHVHDRRYDRYYAYDEKEGE